MRRQAAIAGAVLLLAVLLLPAAAWAASGSTDRPFMLAYNFSRDFRQRPVTVSPFGNGFAISTLIGKLRPHKGRPIRWHSWAAKSARGTGTMWINDGKPDIASGTWHGRTSTLYLSRVRYGRYTRLTLRRVLDGTTHTWKLKLRALTYDNDRIYAWR